MTGPTGTTAAAVWRFDAIGTAWQIETSAPLDDAARALVDSTVAASTASGRGSAPTRSSRQLAAGAGTVPAPPDAADMLDAYVALDRATGGAVNPLVGASLEARGYDAAYGFVDRGARAGARGLAAAAVRGPRASLRLAQPALIDVGALGKGRLVDRVLAGLRPRIDGAARRRRERRPRGARHP